MTNLDILKTQNPELYWLGRIVHIHEIGEYAFVEYMEKIFFPKGHGEETGEHLFSIYIHGDNIGQSASTLDIAMIRAIAYKYDGCNSHAADYFLRGIGYVEHRDYLIILKQAQS